MRIGITAGEASGDVLAAGLIKSLKALYPNAVFEGIGGKHMMAHGFVSLEDMDQLSVMGLVEVLKHLPTLLGIRKRILKHFEDNPPDVFIGVDAPDFNLPIETKLKARGIKTVHYVSPTVWAWRERRIHKIAKATHLVLGIFPFEDQSYAKYNYPFAYVGHTLADEIPLAVDQGAARAKLDIPPASLVLALLPGSRAKEIDTLLPIFLESAKAFFKQVPAAEPPCVIIPAVNPQRLAQITSLLKDIPFDLDLRLGEFEARDVMIAADVVLLASGTASLECMLCKRPMVVAYKLSAMTHTIMQYLYYPDYFALPNILAGEALVPEFLQEEVNPDNLSRHLLAQLHAKDKGLIARFTELHKQLKCDADKQAAMAIKELLDAKQ